ncbi:MAG: DUF3883 domain-containing protein, partial [Candidatus Helarchaeota archaeon]
IFTSKPLIFVPDSKEKYYRLERVIWLDFTHIFKDNCVCLEKHYPSLKKLFVDKLGVNEKPEPKDFAAVLINISRKGEEISENDKNIILRIYEELNNNLKTERNKELLTKMDWWERFIGKPIFLTDKGEFWTNKGRLFLNDDNQLYELFKADDNIAFLWLKDSYHHDRIKYFIQACKIPRISKNVKIKPYIDGSSISKNEKLTRHIRNCLQYIYQYLFWKKNDTYEELKRKKIFNKIGMIEVFCVDKLEVEYSISGNGIELKKIDNKGAILHNSKLYFVRDNKNHFELLQEFSKLFGDIEELNLFIFSIYEKDIQEIKRIMKTLKIKELPENERIYLNINHKARNKENFEYDTADLENELKNISFPQKNEWLGTQQRKLNTSRPLTNESLIENTEDNIIPSYIEDNKETSINKEHTTANTKEMEREYDKVIESENESSSVYKTWLPQISPEEAPIVIDNNRITIKSQINNKSIDIIKKEDEYTFKNKDSLKQTIEYYGEEIEKLSKSVRKKIGRWGEEYAFRCIKSELSGKYSNTKLIETDLGFKLMKEENIITEVIWLNKLEEKMEHFDIKIYENNNTYFIEVKTTKEYNKTWFPVSKDQWRMMNEKGENFYIYRVYGAGTDKPRLEKISNPAKLWLDGKINAYPIRIEL